MKPDRGRSDRSKILVVDDPEHGIDTLSRRLALEGYAVDVANSGPEVLDKIRKDRYDMVVLDMAVLDAALDTGALDTGALDRMTPGMSGLDLLRLLRATYAPSELPVIAVTPPQGDAADVLRSGASDYVIHPVHLPEIAARIETQLSRAKTPHPLNFLDALTGLGNRAALLEGLSTLLSSPHVDDVGTAALLRLDLDGFQSLNDSLGESAGDDLLREASRRLQDALRSVPWADSSCVARIGGDEFAVAGPSQNRNHLEQTAAAILEHLNRPLIVRGFRLALNASIGIAAAGGEKTSAEGLLRDAHLAMEQARQLGGNRFEFFDAGLQERSHDRMSLALELRDALEEDRLSVLYQPKIRLPGHRIDGFEALLRWRRANGQIVPPGQFIPVAEETGLIREIGEWVLRQACRQLGYWQKEFPSVPPLTMNVNVSVKQLTDQRLVEQARQILDETGIAPETLKLELTESALMSEVESAREVLANLRSLRVGLKLDDFGTGYASLSYLRAMRFDSLKIARCFVSRLGADREARAIVESIVNLAHALDMNVVAEGIETEQQLAELEKMGCDLAQGFLFHKPLEAAAAESLLKRESGFAPAQVPRMNPSSALAPGTAA